MPTEKQIEAASLAIIDYLDKFHPAPEGFLYTAMARDALTAAEEVRGQTVLDGLVLVPSECTDEIAEAIGLSANCCGGIAETIYRAMLDATHNPGCKT